MYPNVLEINLKNMFLKMAVTGPAFQIIFWNAVKLFNDFFLQPNVRTKNRKYILYYRFNPNGTITVILLTQYPIPNPNRAGNCLRQLTVLMKNVGGWSYLTSSMPGKLFRSVV